MVHRKACVFLAAACAQLLILLTMPVLSAHGAVVPRLAGSYYHTLALLDDGTVKAWGQNSRGQLGDGTYAGSSSPVTLAALGGKAVSIAAGYFHSTVLMDDGTVKAWGDNNWGQLGNSTIAASGSNAPVAVLGLGGKVVAIAAGQYHTVALMDDGTVKAWGRNDNGQLGDGTNGASNTPVAVKGLGGQVAAIAAGASYTVALMVDGTVKAWGSNGFGQLGNDSTTDSNVPVNVLGLGGPATVIAAGGAHAVALVGGVVKAWGNNGSGQLGNGTTTSSSTAVTASALTGTVVSIAAGYNHTVAFMGDGSVKVWGQNGYGQLGDGSTTDNGVPVVVSGLGGEVSSVATGYYYTLVMMGDGSVRGWGMNDSGQLGNGTTTMVSTPVAVTGLIGKAAAVAAGYNHTVALMVDGSVKAWGLNGNGQLGNGTTRSSSIPVAVTGLGGSVAAIAAGYTHTIALMTDGTVKAWGGNSTGQLGDGTTTDSSTPVTVTGLGGPVKAIAAGLFHSVALMVDGSVKAWGANGSGQLGSDVTWSSSPVAVAALGGTATAIATGGDHTVALMSGGTVKAWGHNYDGQLGNGNTGNSNTPVSVTSLQGTAVAIRASYYHTVALLADGTVKAWGKNSNGQLGSGNFTGSSSPVGVTGLGGPAIGIAAGGDHTLALMSDNSLTSWGLNTYGALGNDTFGSRNTPAPVTGLAGKVTSLTAGSAHSAAVMEDGSISAWGYNVSGQLGDGHSSLFPSTTHVNLFTQRLDVGVTGTGSGSVQSSPARITCATGSSSGCSGLFSPGQQVTLLQTPSPGSTFVGWSGDCSGTGACVVTMDGVKNVTAVFNLPINGVCGPDSGQTLTAAPPTERRCTSGTDFEFSGTGPWTWKCSGTYGGSHASCSADIRMYKANVTVGGTGSGTVTSIPGGISCTAGPCSGTFPAGTEVKLHPSPTNSALSWSGVCAGSGDCVMLMDGDKNATVTFTALSAKVKIAGDPTVYYLVGPALDAVMTTGKTINAKNEVLVENVIMSTPYPVRVIGGYTDDTFTTRTSTSRTIIDGSIVLRRGKLAVERLGIR